MKTLWVDTETTGLDNQVNKIVELACVYEEGDKTEEFHKYIKYSKYPDDYKQASDITGLTPEVLAGKGEPLMHVHDQFIDFLETTMHIDRYNKSDKAILAGYNVGFDDGMLRTFFKDANDNYYGSWFLNCRLDVMAIVAIAIKNGILPLLSKYSLESVANHLKIEFKPHSAIDDINVTREIYYYLESKLKDN